MVGRGIRSNWIVGGPHYWQFFPRVALFRYPDELLVSETQPLIDYIVSTKAGEAIVVQGAKISENLFNMKSMNTAQFILPKTLGC